MDAPSPFDRPNLYVVARLLERLWREESAILKTKLQVSSNLNYDVFRKYLTWMLDRGLAGLENSEDGHERVVLTPKGEAAYHKMVQWMNEIVRDNQPRR